METTQLNENPVAEATPLTPDTIPQAIYNRAAHLLLNSNKDGVEVRQILINEGLDAKNANHVVTQMEDLMDNAKKAKAKKDMIYGALWCVGGTVLTMAHIGFIFWGAIVFGGIQFFRGVSNYQ